MTSLTDQQLLHDYAGRGSESAFAELVRRHVDFVYSAALRMVLDAHLAEDVTQGAFVALAQNARQLTGRPVLSGWLHRTAQNLAANAVRSNVRRRAREQEAAAMNELLSPESDAPWEHIAPHLDAALGELSEPDRDVLLLRYFERKTAREMAQILGTSEDAAQKRVSRAVERLREFFAKRGVTVGAGGLVVVITANAVQAAPAGLALAISTAAVLAGTAVHTSTAIAATKAITMTMMQKTLIGAALAAAAGTGIYEAGQALHLRDQVQTLQQQQAPLTEQVQQLQRERDAVTKRMASLADEIAKIKNDKTELLKLRGETTGLRQDSEELARIKSMQSQATNKTDGQGNFLSFVMAGNKAQMTNAALRRVIGLRTKLGLTPDQEQKIQAILLSNIETAAQLEMNSLTGNQSGGDAKNQIQKLHADEETQIAALLNPEQQAADEEMKKEQAASSAMSFAKREASAMNGYLQLSPEQYQAVISILASLPAGQGGSGDATDSNAKAQLEMRLQALAQTLSPDQLQTYRQMKLADIDQAAMELHMEQQMFKSFSK